MRTVGSDEKRGEENRREEERKKVFTKRMGEMGKGSRAR